MVIQIIIKKYFITIHTMSDFILKNLKKNNCSALYLFQKKFKELENNIWRVDDLKNLITKQSNFGKLCFKEKSIIGFCIGNKIFDAFEIYSIFVDPIFRRKGIATRILNECKIFCHEKNLKRIILEVNVENEAAKRFYILNQFKNSGVRKDYYFNESGRNDAQVMELEIFN